MDNLTTPEAAGEPTRIYMLRAFDLESVVRKIINEELTRREEERNSLMITTGEVCRRLGIDPSTLWRWRKAGRLKGTRVGREYLYKETDISQMIAGGRRQ